MKEFNWKEFLNRNNKIAVHCNTEEEADDFCKQMHEHGLLWRDGESYTENNYWFHYKNQTYYSNNGCYGISLYYQNVYTLLEWSDYMEKPFTKADLKTGMIVTERCGKECIVFLQTAGYDGVIVDIEAHKWSDLRRYNDDLTYNGCIPNKDLDIMKVETVLVYNTGCLVEKEERELIWERIEEEPIKEITMEDLEKHFGCKVKIVAKEN